MSDVTRILSQINDGDPLAAERLLSLSVSSTLIAVIVVIVVAVLAVAALLLRSRKASTYSVRLADIPRVFHAVASTRQEATFAVFMFETPDRSRDDNTLSIQFSFEEGALAWIGYLSVPGTSRINRGSPLAVSLGYKPQLQELNEVRYLRVVDGDLPALSPRWCLSFTASAQQTRWNSWLTVLNGSHDVHKCGR